MTTRRKPVKTKQDLIVQLEKDLAELKTPQESFSWKAAKFGTIAGASLLGAGYLHMIYVANPALLKTILYTIASSLGSIVSGGTTQFLKTTLKNLGVFKYLESLIGSPLPEGTIDTIVGAWVQLGKTLNFFVSPKLTPALEIATTADEPPATTITHEAPISPLLIDVDMPYSPTTASPTSPKFFGELSPTLLNLFARFEVTNKRKELPSPTDGKVIKKIKSKKYV